MQLGARIDQLQKEGYVFETKWEHKKNRYNEDVSFKRYYLGGTIYAEDITGSSISIPEGYSVYDIENFNQEYGRASQTGGYDVWFLNDGY